MISHSRLNQDDFSALKASLEVSVLLILNFLNRGRQKTFDELEFIQGVHIQEGTGLKGWPAGGVFGPGAKVGFSVGTAVGDSETASIQSICQNIWIFQNRVEKTFSGRNRINSGHLITLLTPRISFFRLLKSPPAQAGRVPNRPVLLPSLFGRSSPADAGRNLGRTGRAYTREQVQF